MYKVVCIILALISVGITVYGRYLYRDGNDGIEFLRDLEEDEETAEWVYECDRRRKRTLREDKRYSKRIRMFGAFLVLAGFALVVATLVILFIQTF